MKPYAILSVLDDKEKQTGVDYFFKDAVEHKRDVDKRTIYKREEFIFPRYANFKVVSAS